MKIASHNPIPRATQGLEDRPCGSYEVNLVFHGCDTPPLQLRKHITSPPPSARSTDNHKDMIRDELLKLSCDERGPFGDSITVWASLFLLPILDQKLRTLDPPSLSQQPPQAPAALLKSLFTPLSPLLFGLWSHVWNKVNA